MDNRKYIDTSAGLYTGNYPILYSSNGDVFEIYKHNLRDLLKNCIWFQCASKTEKENMLYRLKKTTGLIKDIKTMIKTKHPDLNIKHISIGGSYLFKTDEINDIDFNIIVAGSHFSYVDIFEINEINEKLPIKVKKISLMIFGEDDFLSDTNVDDSIEVEDYIHTSLCMREGLVFPMRNVLIYGRHYDSRGPDRKNLITRIKRQLFHARLMIEGKIDLHRNANARLLKSISRIAEAFLYLSVVFPQLKIPAKNILKKEKILSKSLQRTDVVSWLEEAGDYIEFLSNNEI